MNTRGYTYTLEEKTEVKVVKTAEKKRYVKVEEYGEANFLCLTEEQFNLLRWLSDNDYFCSWEEINPNEIFEEV